MTGKIDKRVSHVRMAVPPRPEISPRGTETVNAILEAARRVLVEEGAPSFTLRRIAAECGMKIGNVNRHFPRKEIAVKYLVDFAKTITPEAVGTLAAPK